MSLPRVSGKGNLVADPELKYTPNGAAVINITVASTERKKNQQTDEWEDGDQAFLRLTMWKETAERFAGWAYKGCAVHYEGQLFIRDFEGRDGTKGRSVEVKFADVYPDPDRNEITVRKVQRGSQDGGGQPSSGGGGRAWGGRSSGSAPSNDGNVAGSGWGRTGSSSGSKWGSSGGGTATKDPWAAPPQPDEPPF